MTFPNLSPRAKEALETELQNPTYKGMDEDIAAAMAVDVLVRKERIEEVAIFDHANPTDQIFLTLAKP